MNFVTKAYRRVGDGIGILLLVLRLMHEIQCEGEGTGSDFRMPGRRGGLLNKTDTILWRSILRRWLFRILLDELAISWLKWAPGLPSAIYSAIC